MKSNTENVNQTTYKPVKVKMNKVQAIITKDGEIIENIENVTTLVDNGQIELTTSHYLIVSDEASKYLLKVLSSNDYVRFMKLALDIKKDTNVIYNGNYPHNRTSLNAFLKINGSQFERFIRTLLKYGIIYIEKGSSSLTGKVAVTYTINPFIVRKRKIFDDIILLRFANLDVLNKKLDADLSKTKQTN